VLALLSKFSADLIKYKKSVGSLAGMNARFTSKTPIEVAKLLQGYRQVRAEKVPFYV